MSEFSSNSFDCNVESIERSNNLNISNDSSVLNNKTGTNLETQTVDDLNNANANTNEYEKEIEEYCKTLSDEESKEFKESRERHEKQGFHFVYEENIIKSHPHINTNIIFKEHADKLIYYSNFEYNYKEKNFIYDSENYQTNLGDEEEDYFFITSKIYSDEKVIVVEGTIGYSYDPADIKLIYNLEENKIYIGSHYRFLHSESDGKLFFDKYKITNGLVILNKTSSDGKTEELVQITNNECELHEKTIDSIPYFRFPRSKDGVSVPRVIYNIFKVFQDPNSTHPEIIIPSEFYAYSNVKFTKIDNIVNN